MLKLLGAGMFEAKNFAALRVDARHHVFDHAILARGVHRLEDEENGIAIVRVEQILECTETVDLGREQFAIVRF